MEKKNIVNINPVTSKSADGNVKKLPSISTVDVGERKVLPSIIFPGNNPVFGYGGFGSNVGGNTSEKEVIPLLSGIGTQAYLENLRRENEIQQRQLQEDQTRYINSINESIKKTGVYQIPPLLPKLDPSLLQPRIDNRTQNQMKPQTNQFMPMMVPQTMMGQHPSMRHHPPRQPGLQYPPPHHPPPHHHMAPPGQNIHGMHPRPPLHHTVHYPRFHPIPSPDYPKRHVHSYRSEETLDPISSESKRRKAARRDDPRVKKVKKSKKIERSRRTAGRKRGVSKRNTRRKKRRKKGKKSSTGRSRRKRAVVKKTGNRRRDYDSAESDSEEDDEEEDEEEDSEEEEYEDDKDVVGGDKDDDDDDDDEEEEEDDDEDGNSPGFSEQAVRPAQPDCCIQGCQREVKNRLRFSLKSTAEHELKQDYIRTGWNKICHHHYFSDLYQYKKKQKNIGETVDVGY